MLEPDGAAPSAGSGSNTLDDLDDQRALARVLEAQRTVAARKQAIDVLERLVGKNLANVMDRLFLAQLQDASGNWPKALAIYRELNGITKNVARPADP